MVNRVTGPILTETRKDVVQGVYDSPSRQAENDHWNAIEENLTGALFDLQWLFNHADQKDLIEIVGSECEPDVGPIPRLEHVRPPIGELKEQLYGKQTESTDKSSQEKLHPRRPFGLMSDEQANELAEHVDEKERVVPESEFPEAQTKLEQIIERLLKPNKASPKLQEVLIDSVAFICRVAEAGELNVDQLIEHGVEAYYQRTPTKEGQMIHLQRWSEEKWGGILKRKGDDRTRNTTPAPTHVENRYLRREEHVTLQD